MDKRSPSNATWTRRPPATPVGVAKRTTAGNLALYSTPGSTALVGMRERLCGHIQIQQLTDRLPGNTAVDMNPDGVTAADPLGQLGIVMLVDRAQALRIERVRAVQLAMHTITDGPSLGI